MKFFRTLYHFLGGIQFALILISCVALFVIAGTLIESSTQSHRYASQFTYSNPLFGLLLWGFFINILFSATRRWPFKVRHVPFLITHFGLLMILSGTLAKHYFGLQGTMSIMEGSASQDILLNDTYAVQIEKKEQKTPTRFEIKRRLMGGFDSQVASVPDGLKLYLLDYAPHSTERLASWIKNDFATILGFGSMPVYKAYEDQKDLPISGKVRFGTNEIPWNFYALRTTSETINQILKRLYFKDTTIRFTERSSKKLLKEVPLEEIVKQSTYLTEYGNVSLEFDLNFSPIEGFVSPLLKIAFEEKESTLKMKVPLKDSHALLNFNETTPFLGSLPVAVDIDHQPILAFIEDEHFDCHLISFDSHGKVWWFPFRNEMPETLVVYDDGFRGYGARAPLPFSHAISGRDQLEAASINHLRTQLQQALNEGMELSLPLDLFQKACKQSGVDFIDNFLAFLSHWDNLHCWLYPEHASLPNELSKIMTNIDWNTFPKEEWQGCLWNSHLFALIEPSIQTGIDLLEILHQQQWPLLDSLKAQRTATGPCSPEESEELLTSMTRQIFVAANNFQDQNWGQACNLPEQNARLFTAYLRAYGIHLKTISTLPFSEEESEPTIIETLLYPIHKEAMPSRKLEENVPKITLQARKGKLAQTFSLCYDRFANGLKWPILNGEYIVRFQPSLENIPYRVRLRSARQINYSNSSQAYSYESDVIITDQRNGDAVEKTISMNQVHETWDGYRFYLSSIAPPDEGAVKKVQIVVNYDPAKYWLTYPGAIILTCGILLLFCMRPYKRKG